MEKEVFVTMTVNVGHNKKVVYVISRSENDNTESSLNNDIAKLNYIEKQLSDSVVVSTVRNLMSEACRSEDKNPTYTYDLKISLIGDSGVEDSAVESYRYLRNAYDAMLDYINGREYLPLRSNINTQYEIVDFSGEDYANRRKSSGKRFDNLSDSVKKKCKDYCLNIKALCKKNGFYAGYYCTDCYKCTFSTGDEEKSGGCICRSIGMAVPSDWDV